MIPSFSFTPNYLTRDGRPWFPLMGEFHYSRVNAADWETELLKMRSGGIDIVSTYCIWIHHEEIRGEYLFSGNRDLRRFLETARRCGLLVFLRIGPWAHGEVRNGGFPDWLTEMGRSGVLLRSDDPAYLAEVRRFYGRLFRETEGLLLKDGGPVVGVQIENEYGHCGGLTGPEGERHMRTLTAMAKEAGFDVPLMTATGWGGAVTGGLLPVMGGYCEAPWDQRLTEIEPSGNYLFTAERNDHAIGSDHGIGDSLTFDMEQFPYLTAELGGGLQVTRHRRPVAGGRDIEAMTLAKLGSGCSLLGYYMYHGGTNPEGRLSTLQESRETGYPNDLPVLSYDFNAPVREYGQLTDTYRRIRRLAMFLRDFGEDLCRMDYIPQPGNPSRAEDAVSLRTAVRYDGRSGSGYLFVNNYQRRRTMADHRGAALTAFGKSGGAGDGSGAREVLADFGSADVPDGACFFYPFRMKLRHAGGSPLHTEDTLRHAEEPPLHTENRPPHPDGPAGKDGDVLLLTAKAVPLCILPGNEYTTYVFYTKGNGSSPDYRTDRRPEEAGIRLLTLGEEDALRAVKITIGGCGYLLITGEGDDLIGAEAAPDGSTEKAASLTEEPSVNGREGRGERVLPFLRSVVTAECRPAVRAFPALPRCPEGFTRRDDDGCFAVYEYEGTLVNPLEACLSPEEPADAPSSGGRYGAGDRGDLPESPDLPGRAKEGRSPGPLRCRLSVSGIQPGLEEALLLIRYEGESAELRQPDRCEKPLRSDRRAADNFYTGQVWETGVRHFADRGKAEFELTVHPLFPDTPVFLETRPDFSAGPAMAVREVSTAAVFEIPFPLSRKSGL